MVMMMTVATLTRPKAACPLDPEGRCAEDGVSGVEERDDKRVEKDKRESVCVCREKGDVFVHEKVC